jgi:hypothetical protein
MMIKVLALAALVASASAGAANKTAAIAKLMVRERARGRGRRKMRKNALRRRAWRACAPGATGGPVPPPAARAGASPSAHPRVGPRSHHPPCPSSGRGADGGAVWTAAALKNPLDSEREAGAHGVGGPHARARRARARHRASWPPCVCEGGWALAKAGREGRGQLGGPGPAHGRRVAQGSETKKNAPASPTTKRKNASPTHFSSTPSPHTPPARGVRPRDGQERTHGGGT